MPWRDDDAEGVNIFKGDCIVYTIWVFGSGFVLESYSSGEVYAYDTVKECYDVIESWTKKCNCTDW